MSLGQPIRPQKPEAPEWIVVDPSGSTRRAQKPTPCAITRPLEPVYVRRETPDVEQWPKMPEARLL